MRNLLFTEHYSGNQTEAEKWAGRVIRKGEVASVYEILVENNLKDCLEDLALYGRTI
jgi:hypothetical protein